MLSIKLNRVMSHKVRFFISIKWIGCIISVAWIEATPYLTNPTGQKTIEKHPNDPFGHVFFLAFCNSLNCIAILVCYPDIKPAEMLTNYIFSCTFDSSCVSV